MAEQDGNGSTEASQDDQTCGRGSETAPLRKLWSESGDHNRTLVARAHATQRLRPLAEPRRAVTYRVAMRTKSLANAAIGVMLGAVLGGILLATVGHSSGHNVLLVFVPMALTGALLLALSLKRHDES